MNWTDEQRATIETTGKSIVGTLEDAILLAESTGVHSLAVGLGNAHGFYKGKPELDFVRLHEINDALSIPLVLHGGTGIPEGDIQRAIREGINKVNVGTELHHTYLAAMREYLAEDVAPNVLFAAEKVVEAVKQPIKRWIRLCMADGKA